MYFGRISRTDLIKNLRRFIFMKNSLFFLPHKKVFFSYREQKWNIFFFYYMPFFEKNAFFSSFMICVISWHKICPTASSVLISFIQNPFSALLFLQSVILYILRYLFVKICVSARCLFTTNFHSKTACTVRFSQS